MPDNTIDGTPDAVKVACPVWSGGKSSDYFKGLPITISRNPLVSYYLDNWDSIDFDDKRKAADGLISTIKATSDHVQIEWKI